MLINNAGIASSGTNVRDGSVEEAKRCMDINYLAPYILCKEAIPHLQKVKGNIVFTASIVCKINTCTQNGSGY